MKPRELDKKFYAGEDITKHLYPSKAHRPRQEQRRVNVDFPVDDRCPRQGSQATWRTQAIIDQDTDRSSR